MKPYARDQNLRDSIYKFLEACLTQSQTTFFADTAKTIRLKLISGAQEVKFENPSGAASNGILIMNLLDEASEDESAMRDEALLQLTYLYKLDEFQARFCRNHLFYQMGLKSESQNQKTGFIPFKDYWGNPTTPNTEDQLIVNLMGGMGWRELKAGQPGRYGSFITDPSVIHYYATLTILY